MSPHLLSSKVGGFIGREVRCLDIAGYTAVFGVGVALIIFAIWAAIPAIQTHGWTMEMIPRYAFLGAVGSTGLIVSIVALKWIVEGIANKCHYHKIRSLD